MPRSTADRGHTETFANVVDRLSDARLDLGAQLGPGADGEDRHGRDEERQGVDTECRPGSDERDDETGECRTDQPHHHLAQRAGQRVGMRQLVLGHDVGHDRSRCRVEERVTDADESHEHGQMPQLDRAADR